MPPLLFNRKVCAYIMHNDRKVNVIIVKYIFSYIVYKLKKYFRDN